MQFYAVYLIESRADDGDWQGQPVADGYASRDDAEQYAALLKRRYPRRTYMVGSYMTHGGY